MIFIVILALVATMLAGSAAYFSVYGLAVTFSGAFWAVVVMGASLEAGKLVAASYLYRYWKQTGLLMKTYLIAGIVAVMGLTSVGVFGYLSAGYQAEMLPLKQMEERVIVLEEDRKLVFDRKRELDAQIASASINVNVNQSNGRIDPRAVAAMKQAEASRKAQVETLKPEQTAATARLAALDKEILELKTQRLHHEAKIGPIMYIADVFGLPPDNATKYLILIIIFAFDPMAVVLTLAVNIAIRIREENKQKEKGPTPSPDPEPLKPTKLDRDDIAALVQAAIATQQTIHQATEQIPASAIVQAPVVVPTPPTVEPELPSVPTSKEPEISGNLHVSDTNTAEEVFPELYVPRPNTTPRELYAPEEQTAIAAGTRQRVFSGLISTDNVDKVLELLKYYHEWKTALDSGVYLSPDDQWEMEQIHNYLVNTRWAPMLDSSNWKASPASQLFNNKA